MIRKIWLCIVLDYYNFRCRVLLEKKNKTFDMYKKFDLKFRQTLEKFEKALEGFE